MGGVGEECGSGSERDQEETDTTSGGDDHVKTRRGIECGVCQGQLALVVEGENYRLGEGLAQDMEKHPQQNESGQPMTSLGGINKQGEQADQKAEGETATPRQIGGAAEFDPVVVDDGATTENFGEETVSKVIEELGNENPQRRRQCGGDDEGRANTRYRRRRFGRCFGRHVGEC